MLAPKTPVASSTTSSRGLLCHPPATMSGALARRGGAVVRCCALPNDKAKKKTSIPTSSAQIFNVKGGEGGVHFHIHGAGQATEWDAVPISAEAKALLQKHAVKASTALKMHAVLGFEDVADLQRLSPGLVAQLELRPLQLEPLVHLLREQQQPQGTPLVDLSQAQDHGQQQNTGHWHAQLAGQATPPGGEPPVPAMQQAADSSPASADPHQDAGEPAALASVGPAAKAGALPAEPAARAALPGTGGHVGYPRPSDAGLHTHPCVAALEGKPGTINSVAITPDGRRAVTAGPGSKLYVWDLGARSCIATLEGHSDDVIAVVVSPDGRRAVSRSDDLSLRVWDLGTCACVASVVAKTCSPAVAITPDGRHALYGDGARLYNWALDQPWGAWEVGRCVDDANIWCIAVTPDGRQAVTGGLLDRLRVWNLDKGTQVEALGSSRPYTTSLAMTPDGRQLVLADFIGSHLNVWDLARRTCTGAMSEAVPVVTCLAITPDGRGVVAGSRHDHMLRVWDLASRTCTGVMHQPSADMECVAITPDGRYAVSGGKELRVWDLSPGPQLEPARCPAVLQRLSGVLAAAAAAVGLKYERSYSSRR